MFTDNKISILDDIDKAKLELETFRSKNNEGIAIRSRIKWMEFGEKPSNFFF